MKKVIFALFVVAFVTPLGFAEEPWGSYGKDNSVNPAQPSSNATVPASGTSVTTPAITATFTGKVDYVSNGDTMNGQKAQISVKDDNGQVTTFVVASDAAITGKDGSSSTLNWINQEDKVNVEYITDQDGTRTARSIKVSSGW
jgi:hypothetical protein